MIFKNTSGVTDSEVHITYDYDVDGYPGKADIVAISLEGTSAYNVFYTYK